ncbi:MAG: YeaH/YhbH family protein, partial [Caulobacteraceae bacterium]
GDVDQRETVSVPIKRIAEPRLHHASQGGDRDRVFPGNKEYVQGDTLPKPRSGPGGDGSKASPDGEGEDDFSFTLSREEYLDVLFEELELPDLAKTQLKDATSFKYYRAGHSPNGTPSNLNLVRTMRHSLARRICMGRPRTAEFLAVDAEIVELEAKAGLDTDEAARLEALKAGRDQLWARARRIPYLDPIDLRYNRFEPSPQPNARAVMFCLMDVSGSMTEDMKDLAKRFFLLLHMFLHRRYDKVELVFIRHTSEAKEVDEETFFHSRETGGTLVSSALLEMKRIIAERYPVGDWNIYAAQASDGDNYGTDGEACLTLLREDILPVTQYFAYIEVHDARQAEIFMSNQNVSDLWKDYDRIAGQYSNFAMKRVFSKADVFPVFHQLFAKSRKAA